MDSDLEVPKAQFNVIFPVAVVGLVGILAYIAFVTGSDVSGTLRGSDGSWSFSPDHCISGQTVGFHGVELTAKPEPLRVRVIQEPTGGVKVALLEGAAEPTVLTKADCTTLEATVRQGNVVSNDIHLLQGELTLDCPAAAGTVTFSGCGD